jgi:hypothetical protein
MYGTGDCAISIKRSGMIGMITHCRMNGRSSGMNPRLKIQKQVKEKTFLKKKNEKMMVFALNNVQKWFLKYEHATCENS